MLGRKCFSVFASSMPLSKSDASTVHLAGTSNTASMRQTCVSRCSSSTSLSMSTLTEYRSKPYATWLVNATTVAVLRTNTTENALSRSFKISTVRRFSMMNTSFRQVVITMHQSSAITILTSSMQSHYLPSHSLKYSVSMKMQPSRRTLTKLQMFWRLLWQLNSKQVVVMRTMRMPSSMHWLTRYCCKCQSRLMLRKRRRSIQSTTTRVWTLWWHRNLPDSTDWSTKSVNRLLILSLQLKVRSCCPQNLKSRLSR